MAELLINEFFSTYPFHMFAYLPFHKFFPTFIGCANPNHIF